MQLPEVTLCELCFESVPCLAFNPWWGSSPCVSVFSWGSRQPGGWRHLVRVK